MAGNNYQPTNVTDRERGTSERAKQAWHKKSPPKRAWHKKSPPKRACDCSLLEILSNPDLVTCVGPRRV
jgi:hypothetical protein